MSPIPAMYHARGCPPWMLEEGHTIVVSMPEVRFVREQVTRFEPLARNFSFEFDNLRLPMGTA
jgi:hypothetical protein